MFCNYINDKLNLQIKYRGGLTILFKIYWAASSWRGSMFKWDTNMKLNMKLQILTVLAILISMSVLQVTSVIRNTNYHSERELNTISGKSEAFEYMVGRELKQLQEVVDTYNENARLVEALNTNVSSVLAQELDYIYANLSREVGITNLRVTRPDFSTLYNSAGAGMDHSSGDQLLLNQVANSGGTASAFDTNGDGLALAAAGVIQVGGRDLAILEVRKQITDEYMLDLHEGLGVDYSVFLGQELAYSSLSRNNLVSTQMKDANVVDAVLTKGQAFSNRIGGFSNYDIFGSFAPIRNVNGDVIGMVLASESAMAYDEQNKSDILIGIVWQVVIQAVFFFIFYPIIQYKIAPIADMTKAIENAADYDYSTPVSEKHMKHPEEIGMMAKAIHQMQENTKRVIHQILNSAQMVSGSSDDLLQSSEHTLKSLKEAEQFILSIQSMSATQMNIANETATAMDEMANGVNHVAETASSITEDSSEMKKEADTGKVAVADAVQKMNDIQESAKQITDATNQLVAGLDKINIFVNTINDISAQTNLLALNASIEAARAGEHGRGFAVVADEVRKLAEESAQSTKEINSIVAEIKQITKITVDSLDHNLSETEKGIASIHQVDRVFVNILQAINEVAEKIEGLSAVSQQMSAGAEEVSASVIELSKISKDSNENTMTIAERTTKQVEAIENVTESSEKLSSLAHDLRTEVARFKV